MKKKMKLDKENITLILFTALAIFSLLMIVYIIPHHEEAQITPEQRAEKIRLDSFCEDYKLSYYDCTWGAFACFNDCVKLGKDYFKYKVSRYDWECWCELNNETKQIW